MRWGLPIKIRRLAATLIAMFSLACANLTLAQEPEEPFEPDAALTNENPSPTESEPAMSADELTAELLTAGPIDLVTLKNADRAVLRVLPIDFPNREPPLNPRSMDLMIVRLVDDPVTDYELRWKDVASVELYEDRLLKEANRLVSLGRFDDALPFFEILRSEYPTTDGLVPSMAGYLIKDAESWSRKGGHENALVSLYSAYAVDSTTQSLEDRIAEEVDQIVSASLEKDDALSARWALSEMATRYPNNATIARWRARLADEARNLLADARRLLEHGSFREAQVEAMRALNRDPRLDTAKQVVLEAFKKFPRVDVAVMSPCDLSPRAANSAKGVLAGDHIRDLSARRDSRLVSRGLFEYVAPGPEGGEYRSPIAEVEYAEIDQLLTLRLNTNISMPAADRPLTGYDVARRLLDAADPNSDDFRFDWRDLIQSIEVRDVFQVDVRLTRPHVRPERLAQGLSLEEVGSLGNSRDGGVLSAYHLLNAAENEWTFAANSGYFARDTAAPREVRLRSFAKFRQALAALRQGDVSVIDRVSPWELASLRAADDVALGGYAAPTVHVLIPDPSRPLTANRTFRRAVLYAIDRELILRRHLLRGAEVSGCQLISGPFSAGLAFSDPQRYAYNDAVPVRPYDPRLGMALAAMATQQIAADDSATGAAAIFETPPLTLAYPDHEIAATACEAIHQHLTAVGIQVELRPVRGAAPKTGDADLVYTELVLEEPAVDARRLLGGDGIVGGTSAYIRHALDELDAAVGWSDVRQRLYDLHRLAADELPVIPLWQLAEHFAYDPGVMGIGERPVTLFQNIDQWRISPRVVVDGP